MYTYIISCSPQLNGIRRMNLKLTNFSTIIIVNKNQEQTKAIRIKTKHLNRIKHYIGGIVGVFILLTLSIVYLSSKDSKQEQEKQEQELNVFFLQKQRISHLIQILISFNRKFEFIWSPTMSSLQSNTDVHV